MLNTMTLIVRDRTMLVLTGLEKVKKICLLAIEVLYFLIPTWVLSGDSRLIACKKVMALRPVVGRLLPIV